MQRTSAVLTLCVLYPGALMAEPIYLDCQVSEGANQNKFSVKLDEASGKVTHTSKDGSAFNAEGFFAANSISYQKITAQGGIRLTIRYEIDRSSLVANQIVIIEAVDPRVAAAVPAETSTMSGSCTVVRVSGRKI